MWSVAQHSPRPRADPPDHDPQAVLESDMQALGPDIEEAVAASQSMTREEVDEIIQDMVTVHGRDPNFPARVMAMARRYLDDPTAKEQLYEEMKVEAALLKINSPYAEVRAVVSNHDDPSMVRASCAEVACAWLIPLSSPRRPSGRGPLASSTSPPVPS